MDEYDEYEFYSDDDLVPVDEIEEFDVREVTGKKETHEQFLDQIIKNVKETQQEKAKKEQYEWENLKEKANAKLLLYTKNELMAQLIRQIILSTLDQEFKKVMGIENTRRKLKRKKKTELHNRQKNFLFNCIRQQLGETPEEKAPVTYLDDKKRYFDDTINLVTDTGETLAFSNKDYEDFYKCANCGSENLELDEQLGFKTCKKCANRERLSTKFKQFVAYSHSGYSTGAKDMSKQILGFQLFIGGPIGFEMTKEHIARMMREYIETSGILFHSDESKMHSLVDNFKRKAVLMAKEEQETFTRKDLKMMAIRLIMDANPDFFQTNEIQKKQEILRAFNMDSKQEHELDTTETELQNLNAKMSEFEGKGGFMKTIKDINNFEKLKVALIMNQNPNLSKEWVIHGNLLSKPQLATIYMILKKKKQKEIIEMFEIAAKEITKRIQILQNPKTPYDKVFVKKLKKNKKVKDLLGI